jgi:hypothetical protein
MSLDGAHEHGGARSLAAHVAEVGGEPTIGTVHADDVTRDESAGHAGKTVTEPIPFALDVGHETLLGTSRRTEVFDQRTTLRLRSLATQVRHAHRDDLRDGTAERSRIGGRSLVSRRIEVEE